MKCELTPQQKRAARTRAKRALVLACAGSGKTRVIEERIEWLVYGGRKRGGSKYLTPAQHDRLAGIVAFTFTEKAAQELKLRLMARLGALGNMYVGTIHSFCLQRILAEYEPLYRGVVVLDEAARIGFIEHNWREIGGEATIEEYLGGLRGKDAEKAERDLRSRYDRAALFADSVDVVREECILLDPKKARSLKRRRPAFVDALERYDELLRREGLIDYSAMQYWAVEMLERDASVRRDVQSRIDHLLVDEFQDTNEVQLRLIKRLVGRDASLFAVGDDDQAIYEWRGANVENIRHFKRHFRGAKVFTLSCNFRSTDLAVKCAAKAAQLQEKRHKKAMRAAEGAAGKRREVALLEFDDIAQEAEWIARRIKELRGAPAPHDPKRGVDYGDFAILLRRMSYVGYYVEALEKAKIPYSVRGVAGLDEVPQVRMVMAALHMAAERDWRGHGGSVEEVFVAAAAEVLGSEAKARRRLEKFRRWWKKRRRRRIGELQRFFQELCVTLGLPAASDEEKRETELMHLAQISGLIASYQHAYGPADNNLKRLCRFAGYFLGAFEDRRVTPAAEVNAVQILTVHRAKGLEWPVVFVAERRKWPGGRRPQPRWLVPVDLFSADRYWDNPEEEKRILYVALTRAERYLHVTWSLATPGGGDRFTADPYVCKLRASIEESDLAEKVAWHPDDVARPRAKRTIAPPPLKSHFPTTFSQLKYYWRCPADYWLRWMAGFWPPLADELGFGRQVHSLLWTIHERLDSGEEVTEEDIREIAREHFKLPHANPVAEARLREAAVRRLAEYLERVKRYAEARLQAEAPFAFTVGAGRPDAAQKGLISGRIDLLEFREEQDDRIQVAVVEFKSHKMDDQPTFEEAILQAQLYAIGARESQGLDPQQARLELLYEGRAHPVPVAEADLRRARRKLERALGDIIKQHLPSRKAGTGTQSCRSCDYRRICPWRRAKVRNR